MSDEAVTKQIEGTIDEVSQKNGWTTFAIDTGGQWPVKLSTKIEKIISEASAVGEQKAVWTFKESDGGENPNKPGTFYKNRRLEKVEVGGRLERPAGGRDDSTTRTSIERQTIIKASVPIYATFLGDDGGDEEFFRFLDRLAAWVANDMPLPEPPVDPDASDGIPF